jgi:hypothetical protein
VCFFGCCCCCSCRQGCQTAHTVSYQNPLFCYILEGLGKDIFNIFYAHEAHFCGPLLHFIFPILVNCIKKTLAILFATKRGAGWIFIFFAEIRVTGCGKFSTFESFFDLGKLLLNLCCYFPMKRSCVKFDKGGLGYMMDDLRSPLGDFRRLLSYVRSPLGDFT